MMTSQEPPGVSSFRPVSLARDWPHLREHEPVSLAQTPSGKAWLLSRYGDVRHVLSDERFGVAPVTDDENTDVEELHDSIFQDPPAHTRIRRIIAPEFTARRIEARRASVQDRSDALWSATPADGTAFDLMEQYSYPLAMNSIAEIMGVPEPERDWVRTCSDRMLRPRAEDGVDDVGTAWTELNDYVRELVKRRRAEETPDDDLLTTLLSARASGALVSDEELVSLVVGLPIAGYVSTANAIAVAFEQLAYDWLGWLQLNPASVPKFVEEVLRYQSGDNGESMPRYAKEDVDVGGTTIRRGEMIVAPLVAANRDDAVFADPECFDPNRCNTSHLAFGAGIHRCLGSVLARLELQCAVDTLCRLSRSMRVHDKALTTNMFGDVYPDFFLVSREGTQAFERASSDVGEGVQR